MAARDRERLARAFGIEPMQARPAIVAAVACGLIPAAWVGSLAVFAGLGVIRVVEDRAIAAALREVDDWGFPVEGYRDWILAAHPAFDLELRRPVGVELVEEAARAVDSHVEVERRGDRLLRITAPAIELGGSPRRALVRVGNRRLLAELRDRVLAPLHADAGIVAMRMGDRDRLAALVASAAAPAAEGNAFREQAIVAPPELQSLVHIGTSQLRPPAEARTLRLRTDRLIYATGHQPVTSKLLSGWVAAGCLVGLAGGPLALVGPGLGALIGSAFGSGIAYALRRGDHARLARSLGRVQGWPYPVEGYEDWLLSGRPICDVELGAPPDQAWVQSVATRVLHGAELTWLDAQLLRIESAPAHHLAGQGIDAFWGGDPADLDRLARELLNPLHQRVGVVAVRLGGYLDRHA